MAVGFNNPYIWGYNMAQGDNWTAVTDGKVPLLSSPKRMFSNIMKNRQVLRHFVKRDFKVTYHGHFLGYIWSILEPLALTVIFYLVFVILRGSADSLLPLSIMIGILFFNAFSRTFNGCTVALTRNSGLIQQVYFPREIFLASIAGFQFVRLALSLIIIFIYMAWEGLPITNLLLLLPLSMVGITLLAFGLGLLASMCHVRVRDTGQVVQLLLRAGFFLSGVFYSVEHIPSEYVGLHLSNPVAVYIEMARSAAFGKMDILTFEHIGVALVFSALVFIIGSMAFMRYERKAVKYL